MTGKERAALRAQANSLQAIQQVGHNGIGEELIKLRVLETCPLTAREAANELAEKTGSEVIQVIGYRFVLYRKNPDKA